MQCRRFRLGLLDGAPAAQMVSRRTRKFDSVKGNLPADVLDCPTCGVMETGNSNHALMHCPRTEGVWGHAIEVADAAVHRGWHPCRAAAGGMSRASRVGHLLGPRELTGTPAPTEVILRGPEQPLRPWLVVWHSLMRSSRCTWIGGRSAQLQLRWPSASVRMYVLRRRGPGGAALHRSSSRRRRTRRRRRHWYRLQLRLGMAICMAIAIPP